MLVLVAAQAMLGAQLPMIFIVAGLAGLSIAPNPCLATLGVTMIVFGSMTTSTWMSALMQRRGRRFGFFVGTTGAAIGAVIAGFAVLKGNFPLFLLGSYLIGIYQSTQAFYRFAASDTASDSYRPKAISYVLAGGLVAALIGPQMVKLTAGALATPYAMTYFAAAAINLAGLFIFPFLDIPKPVPHTVEENASIRTRRQLLATPEVLVAIICGMVSYALMTLVMTSTPLAVVGCGFSTANAADVVASHVFAMFLPSFFTGHLIARFGSRIIVATGLALLFLSGVVALAGVDLGNFFGALILLGLGWNFGFIGATAMLAETHAPQERGRVQGMNDLMVFGCVTLASLASGGLMNCSGGDAVVGWNAVTLAMLPFLSLAGGALVWLSMMQRRVV